MSGYPEPRRIVLTLGDLRRATVLERARACALVGIGEEQIGPLLRAVTGKATTPEQVEQGATLLYAMALQLERRLDPSLTWEQAQTWDLALDLEAADPAEDAAARAAVDAAVATGLPPSLAGELTLAQVERYSEIQREAGKRRRSPRRGRR